MSVTETFMVRRTAIGLKVDGGVQLFKEPLAVWLDRSDLSSAQWASDKESAAVFRTKKEAILVAKAVSLDSTEWEFDKRLGTEILRQESETIVREVFEEAIEMGVKID